MPSFTKFDSTVGSSTRRLKSPRSVGPSQRAVMMPVTTPMPVIATCPPSTRMTSCAKRGTPFFFGGASVTRRHHRRHRIERVAAGAQHRGPEPRYDFAPERRHLLLERIGGGIEAAHVDGDVRRAELAHAIQHRLRRIRRAKVDLTLLEIGEQHEGAVDVVRMRDLLQYGDAPVLRDRAIGLVPEHPSIRIAAEE